MDFISPGSRHSDYQIPSLSSFSTGTEDSGIYRISQPKAPLRQYGVIGGLLSERRTYHHRFTWHTGICGSIPYCSAAYMEEKCTVKHQRGNHFLYAADSAVRKYLDIKGLPLSLLENPQYRPSPQKSLWTRYRIVIYHKI